MPEDNIFFVAQLKDGSYLRGFKHHGWHLEDWWKNASRAVRLKNIDFCRSSFSTSNMNQADVFQPQTHDYDWVARAMNFFDFDLIEVCFILDVV